MTKGRRDREVPPRPPRVERPADGARAGQERSGPRPPAHQRPAHVNPRKQSGSFVYVLVPAVLVIVLGAGFFWFAGGRQSSPQSTPPNNEQASLLSDVAWPSYVSRGPSAVKEAYQFAVLRPDVLQYMPCFCGCGQHNGHRSNEECFISNMNQGGRTIAFEQHGST